MGVYSSSRLSTSTVFGGRGLPSCLPSMLCPAELSSSKSWACQGAAAAATPQLLLLLLPLCLAGWGCEWGQE